MAYKASAHAVYDLKYHIVWTPKYRKAVLVGEIAQTVQELFAQIAEAYDMEIDTMEVMEDHVHLFLSAPPRYAPARIVQILKSISARELFARFPRLRRQLWGGQLWEDGYFVRSVGDAVTAEIIRRYIRYQKSPQNIQLSLFNEGPSKPRRKRRGSFTCAGHAHALGGCKSLCQPDGGEGQRSARASP